MPRKGRPREERQRWAEAWRVSGTGITAFARSQGLPPASLGRWIEEAEGRPRPRHPRALAPGFHEVELVEPRQATPFVVLLDGCRHSVEVPVDFDVPALRRLVDALC